MADHNPTAANPSDASAAAALEHASPMHMEAVVHDMAGAAIIAAAVLELYVTENELCSAIGMSEGLSWLQSRLSNAAENLMAVQDVRAPRWRTCADAERVQEALAAAVAARDLFNAMRAAKPST